MPRFALVTDVIKASGLDISTLDQVRIDAVGEFAKRAKLAPIHVSGVEGGIEIENGRHRLAYHAQQGLEFIEVRIDEDNDFLVRHHLCMCS